ncbi:MAG: type IV pilus assembly protein PilM [Verrucomicrobia bacterium]|nr:type IV pilus assembly protein PilM [Kiritimatiellia bacterium]MCO6400335.1 type IV pilus assembly protein PilM [Verrucomicrobiota bacterium]
MQRILTLDIGASSIKLGEFAALKSGGLELINFAVGPLLLDPQSDDDRIPQIVATIKELMQERGIKPGPVLLSVSGQSVFSRFVKLPPVDKEKVYQIILYEAQQNVPFPIQEVVWDYQLIGRGEGELDVMLAAIKADIIIQLTEAVERTGLQTDLVDVAPMALYNAVRFNYSDTHDCTLVIDIGARSTDLIFLEEGRVFIRSVPVAGNVITQQIMREFDLSFDDAEEMKRAHAFVAFGGAYEEPKSEVADKVSKIVRNVMTRMHAEIDRSIKFYRSQQNGQSPARILLAGGTSVIPYTDTFLKDKLKVEVDYLNPFINVPVSAAIDAEEIGRHAHELPQLVGLALRKVHACPIEINLLPPKAVQEKSFRRKQPLLVGAAFALALIFVVWALYFLKMTDVAEEQLARVQSNVSALEQVARPLRETEAKIKFLQSRIADVDSVVGKRTEWLDILSEIHEVLPPDLFLLQVTPIRVPPVDPNRPPSDEEQAKSGPPGTLISIDVEGAGYLDKITSATPIREYRDKLREAKLFSPATEITWLPTPAPDQYVRRFKINIVMKGQVQP